MTTSGAVLIAIVGFVVTWKLGERAADRQRQAALDAAQVQIDANAAAIREERHQRRLEDAYAELLQALDES